MEEWLAPLNLVEGVQTYIDIFSNNGLVSPEDLYMSDFKIEDFFNMGVSNENDRTAIYYAINPEELAHLSMLSSVLSFREDMISFCS
jgi:hypothetical protein